MCGEAPVITGPHINWGKISNLRKKCKYRNSVKPVAYVKHPSKKAQLSQISRL